MSVCEYFMAATLASTTAFVAVCLHLCLERDHLSSDQLGLPLQFFLQVCNQGLKVCPGWEQFEEIPHFH